MDSAPTDGTRVLLRRPTAPLPYCKVVIGSYENDKYANTPRPYWRHDMQRLSGMAEARAHTPTGWMPLPGVE